jgi:alkylated DNA repair dioxygenase AlkB
MDVPGLRYLPNWLSEAAQGAVLASVDAAPWSSELRRRVQHYGHRYDYGRRSVASGESDRVAAPIPAWAAELIERLHADGYTAEPADQVIVNEYEPGQGISAHVDCVPCFGPAVAAISLGSSCVMDFIAPGGSTRVGVRLEPGSLSVMTGPSRYTWKHAIVARKSDPGPFGRVPRGRRVSVTFRTVVRGNEEGEP